MLNGPVLSVMEQSTQPSLGAAATGVKSSRLRLQLEGLW